MNPSLSPPEDLRGGGGRGGGGGGRSFIAPKHQQTFKTRQSEGVAAVQSSGHIEARGPYSACLATVCLKLQCFIKG